MFQLFGAIIILLSTSALLVYGIWLIFTKNGQKVVRNWNRNQAKGDVKLKNWEKQLTDKFNRWTVKNKRWWDPLMMVLGLLILVYALWRYPLIWQIPLALIVGLFQSIAGVFAGISTTTFLLLIIIWQLGNRKD